MCPQKTAKHNVLQFLKDFLDKPESRDFYKKKNSVFRVIPRETKKKKKQRGRKKKSEEDKEDDNFSNKGVIGGEF